MLGEDPELLEAIVYNDDNLTYGAIISVCTGPDETVTALTGDGIDDLKDMLGAARITKETWHQFLDDFVDDAELAARIKAQSPRQQPAGYDRSPSTEASNRPAAARQCPPKCCRRKSTSVTPVASPSIAPPST